MNKTLFRKLLRVSRMGAGLLLLPLLCASASAQQSPLVGYEDIDLFANPPKTADLPNVLLVLDTSANWSSSSAEACATYADGTAGPRAGNPGVEQGKKIAIQKCALVNTLLSLPTNADGSARFRVGIMYMNAPNANGAYPRVRFLPVDATNKPILTQALKDTSISSAADQGSNADYARALWEAYLWYKGRPPYLGKSQSNASRVRWDGLAFGADGNYISPAANDCARNYVIIISNGSPQGTEDDVRGLIASASGNATQITYSNSYISANDQNNWADEAARFLRNSDVSSQDGAQNIITYTVAITSASPSPSEVRSNNYIKEIAIQGGGNGYSATNVDELTKALNDVFNQVQAVNSVFASASLPVSVNAQGSFLNQVFMGMFRPDGQSRPRWAGNLKQYQFGYTSATQAVSLIDAAGAVAINPTTGFITPSARSFWTAASPYADFWKNSSWPGEVNQGGASDLPDGQIVEKGGAAQRMRELFLTTSLQASRVVKTCTGSCASLQDFSTANLSPSDFGLASSDTAARDALVAWVRGADNRSPSDEAGPGTMQSVTSGASVTVNVRSSIHGDVIHASPAVINFGGSTGVVVFYGTNGGMLHAVRGANSGANAGNELWSFVPSEFLGKFSRLRSNTPMVQYASTNMDLNPTAQRKDYGMDGPITFYQNRSSGGQTYLYAAMRRGGRALYAFNVTNPASPTLLWKVSNATAGLSALGQTWSEARVTRIAGVEDPVLIMGGGYDPAEDSTPAGTTTMGNVVVVLNARTGAVLKVFTGIDRPVPAAVATVDSDRDGKMDRAYAVDLGGSIYRLAFPGAAPADWTLTKIADFSESSGTGQKMFYAPATTAVTMAGRPVYVVQVGTGDREKPLKASGTENRFFTVLDRGQTSAKVLSDLTQMTAAGLSSIPDSSYGCYYNMPSAGEKVVNAVTYTSGYAFFGTNTPVVSDGASCVGSLGVARSYAIPALCGPVTSQTLQGGGFPPTAVVGTVLIAPNSNTNCDTNPELCSQVPVGIGITPPDCKGNVSLVRSALGATNIYACAPAQRLRRDWSVLNPR